MSKRLLELFLILCLLTPVARAGGAVVCARGGTSSGGGGGTGGDILHETFDPTGFSASGWTNLGVADPDSTVAPPTGSVTGFTTQICRENVPSSGRADIRWDAASPFSTSYLSFYFYLSSDSVANSNLFPLVTLTSSTGSTGDNTWYRVMFLKNADATRSLRIDWGQGFGACTVGTGTTNITTGTGYLIELLAIDNGSSDTIEFKVNGTTVCQRTGGNFWSAAPQRLYLGPNSDLTWQWDASIDTVDISSTGYVN